LSLEAKKEWKKNEFFNFTYLWHLLGTSKQFVQFYYLMKFTWKHGFGCPFCENLVFWQKAILAIFQQKIPFYDIIQLKFHLCLMIICSVDNSNCFGQKFNSLATNLFLILFLFKVFFTHQKCIRFSTKTKFKTTNYQTQNSKRPIMLNVILISIYVIITLCHPYQLMCNNW